MGGVASSFSMSPTLIDTFHVGYRESQRLDQYLKRVKLSGFMFIAY
jgi:hypothetical protein